MWIVKTKRNAAGEATKHKARLVVLGNLQTILQFGLTFAGVIDKTGVCMILLAAQPFGIKIMTMEIAAAFLNGELEEDLYGYPPEGLDIGKNKVLKLKRSLYGLKQAPKQWNITITNFLTSREFVQLPEKRCLFVHRDKDERIDGLIGLYVGDMLITGTSSFLEEEMQALKDRFTVSSEGEATEFLGITIKSSNQQTKISIPGNINHAVKKMREIPEVREMLNCISTDQPVPLRTMHKEQISEEVTKSKGLS